ncbi:hypothetical protein KP509_02G063000 [Ceratopteris richardii]|uniref:Uncharacterized protein n=1 Tax=Ceratopteris richardii TaxID=49495 RepID=A0A8T2V6E9_CERRI|nr:hypothetical protein KP509_02G063000 [Ceratopteris richardii]
MGCMSVQAASSFSPLHFGGVTLSKASFASCRVSRSLSSTYLTRPSASSDKSEPTSSKTGSNVLPPDVDYIVKLTAGSVAGAAVIKYGSLLFPSITQPNIVEAFLMIGLPVIVAVILLGVNSFKKMEET